MTNSSTTKNIVIYADDDKDDLELVQESFAQYSNNVEVLTFLDGHKVLLYLERLPSFEPGPCLIILDVNMPGLNGKDVLIRLREVDRFNQVPVVLFTTSSQPLDKMFASRYNAGFITKPLDIKQMEVITDQFINQCTEEIRKNIRRQIR